LSKIFLVQKLPQTQVVDVMQKTGTVQNEKCQISAGSPSAILKRFDMNKCWKKTGKKIFLWNFKRDNTQKIEENFIFNQKKGKFYIRKKKKREKKERKNSQFRVWTFAKKDKKKHKKNNWDKPPKYLKTNFFFFSWFIIVLPNIYMSCLLIDSCLFKKLWKKKLFEKFKVAHGKEEKKLDTGVSFFFHSL